MTTTSNLHAHVSTHATDCDGPIYREYIMRVDPERDQQFGDDGEIGFRERMLCHIVGVYTCFDGTLTVTSDEWAGLTKILDWSEKTEEGARSSRVEFCTDQCEDVSSFRDIYAEQMNY